MSLRAFKDKHMKINFFTSITFACILFCSQAMYSLPNDSLSTLENGIDKYPYWGVYNKTPISDIKAAKWISTDNVALGWDWSLPTSVKAASKSNLCLARNGGLNRDKIENLAPVNFPCNPVVAHWVNWRDLEPVEGQINFQPLIENIKNTISQYGKKTLRILQK